MDTDSDPHIKEWYQLTECIGNDLSFKSKHEVLKNDVPLNTLLNEDYLDTIDEVLQQCNQSNPHQGIWHDHADCVSGQSLDHNISSEYPLPSKAISSDTINDDIPLPSTLQPGNSAKTFCTCCCKPTQESCSDKRRVQSKRKLSKSTPIKFCSCKRVQKRQNKNRVAISFYPEQPHKENSHVKISKSEAICRQTTSSTLLEHLSKDTSDSDYDLDWLCDNDPVSVASRSTASTSVVETLSIRCPHQNCAKVFKNGISLRKHLTHHGPKMHVCRSCGRAFAEASKLKRHNLVHTGEKPYECEYPDCGMRFSLLHNLQTHQRVHTGCKPFVCSHPGCDKRFTQRTNLKCHLRVHATIGKDECGQRIPN